MADLDGLRFRFAGSADAEAIAALHAESWRRHYRGVYSDAFLDGDVVADRRAVWTDRLREPGVGRQTILAEDHSGVIAFAHTVVNDDPRWGALLDNLHVAHGHKRRGLGSRLLASSARAAIDRGTGLYLWVNERNVAAQAFYRTHGGENAERALSTAPGGITSRLNGAPVKLRYAWDDPTALLGRL